MTYKSLLSPQKFFEREVLPLHPEPADTYEKALWCSELLHVFRELALEFEGRYSDTINLIFSENLVSDVYTIETPLTFVRFADVARLRQDMPEVFEDVAYVRSSDAEKILGRRFLYKLCQEKDKSRILPLEQVNLGDLEKVLTGDELRRYVKIKTKPGIPVVRRRDDL